MTYSEKLKDPRWQRKRLEVLQAADFTCADCGSRTETLHVHHCWYEKGLWPWEYPDVAYRVLCKDCHTKRQGIELDIQQRLSEFSTSELEMISEETLSGLSAFGVEAANQWMRDGMMPEKQKG